MTPAEVAERLKISRAKAYNMLKSGEIAVVRIGTLVRVKELDLMKYIEDRTHAQDPEG